MLDMSVDVRGVWARPGLRKTVRKAAQAAVAAEKKAGAYEASMLLTNDETIRHLNKVYREADNVTDVLSFPAEEEVFLGDIAISLPQARRQAREYGHSLRREAAFLTVHAMLHLMGYTHSEPDDEDRMRKRQREILNEAGFEAQ